MSLLKKILKANTLSQAYLIKNPNWQNAEQLVFYSTDLGKEKHVSVLIRVRCEVRASGLQVYPPLPLHQSAFCQHLHWSPALKTVLIPDSSLSDSAIDSETFKGLKRAISNLIISFVTIRVYLMVFIFTYVYFNIFMIYL